MAAAVSMPPRLTGEFLRDARPVPEGGHGTISSPQTEEEK